MAAAQPVETEIPGLTAELLELRLSGGVLRLAVRFNNTGTSAASQTLSEQRAAAIKQWLVTHAQVSGANISTRGWGKTKPVSHNTKPDGSDDPEGRAKNRRVEIVVRGGG